MNSFEEIAERERHFLLPTYNRYPLAIARGKGVFVYDYDGRRYLDFIAGLGVNALGYSHPRIVKTIRQQAAELIHISNLFYNEHQGRLGEKLCQLSGMSRAFFSNSGTEAMEGALKLARAACVGTADKGNIVAVEGSFHGRTFGALSMTGQEKYRKGFEPLLGKVKFVPLNDAAALRDAVDSSVCAIVLEPIQGEGGIRACSTEFLQAARAAADTHGAVLIFDEIQCGLGRTGHMFAFQHFGVTPDVVTVAKPLAAGLPLGAFLVREPFGNVLSAGKHGTTFGGGPLTCRVALEFLKIIEDENLLERVRSVGSYLHQELSALAERFDVAVAARGVGLMQALELNIPARPLVEAALDEGVLFNATQETVLRFLPPFVLEEKHVDKGIRVLRKLLKRPQSTRAASGT